MFVWYSYQPQQSCGQGNIFAPVCHSVHKGGVCLSACWDTTLPPPEKIPPRRHPLEQTHTPREQTPPEADTPQSRHHTPEQTPPWEHTHPLGADPPQSRHPPSTHPWGADIPWEQTPPPGSRIRYTVNERPVRILLECILVMFQFRSKSDCGSKQSSFLLPCLVHMEFPEEIVSCGIGMSHMLVVNCIDSKYQVLLNGKIYFRQIKYSTRRTKRITCILCLL